MIENGIDVKLTLQEYAFLMRLKEMGAKAPRNMLGRFYEVTIMGESALNDKNAHDGFCSFLGIKP